MLWQWEFLIDVSGRFYTDVKFHPYKTMAVEELRNRDCFSRQASCETILENVPADADVLSSDEAHLNLSGCVNKKNFRYWAADNPRQRHEQPLHREQVTVWCGTEEFRITGPYFFEEECTVAVTSHHYVEMLRNFLQLSVNELKNASLWFQQDGATAHTAREF
jgi:hypothetical protein